MLQTAVDGRKRDGNCKSSSLRHVWLLEATTSHQICRNFWLRSKVEIITSWAMSNGKSETWNLPAFHSVANKSSIEFNVKTKSAQRLTARNSVQKNRKYQPNMTSVKRIESSCKAPKRCVPRPCNKSKQLLWKPFTWSASLGLCFCRYEIGVK